MKTKRPCKLCKRPAPRRKMSDAEKVLRAEFRECLQGLAEVAKVIRNNIHVTADRIEKSTDGTSGLIAEHIEQLAQDRVALLIEKTYQHYPATQPPWRNGPTLVGRSSDYASGLADSMNGVKQP